MKFYSGILLLVANLLPALDTSMTSDAGDCIYTCPVLGVQPVCGTDGNTYPSRCYVKCVSKRQKAVGKVSASIQAPGRCPLQPCICTALVSPVCGTNGRPYKNPCFLECDSRNQQRYGFPPIYIGNQGTCPDRGCVCAVILKPVCGTDGRTYGNACEVGCQSRRQQQIGHPPIFVASTGVCPQSLCNCPQFIAPVCGTNARSYRNICMLECASKINQGEGLPPVYVRSYAVCPQDSCACLAGIDPVCASNGNTYNNECTLGCQNARRFALGQPPLTILYRGFCRDCICPKNYDPVCGSDDITYGNLCELQCENERRQHQNLPPLMYGKGECVCSCSTVYQPVCASDFKTYGNLCRLGCENHRRVHSELPALHATSRGECRCNCSTFDQPVCASNRLTYRNICWFNCENYYLIRNGIPALTILKRGC